MTELETKLVALLQTLEMESKERETRFIEQVSSLQGTVSSLRERLEALTPQLVTLDEQQKTVMSQYNEISQLLAEELQR